MGNFLYHNKWHSYNHHTVPTLEYPDSAIDPIASQTYPFKGIFFNYFPLSSVNGIFVSGEKSDSYGWWSYFNLTLSFSSDWGLWSSVRNTASGFVVNNAYNNTLRYYFQNWNNGYTGFTYWRGFSGKLNDAYLWTLAVSAERIWPLSTEGRSNPVSGLGWHIALSGITWRTNVSAVNTRQKNFGPVAELFANSDGTLFWDVSTAQTAFFLLSENKTITATKLFNVYKGGKYTLWAKLDFCPEPEMNLHFDYNTYRIQVVKYPRKDSYTDNTEVVRLSANNITRIDFVYDGKYMLGKATHYKIYLPTSEDLYFQGLGNTLSPSPYYVSGLAEPKSYINPGPGVVTIPFSTSFTSVSSIYIAGSGVNINYFGKDNVFFIFNLQGARWQTPNTLAATRSLTSSFDRVFGNLSGGSYEDPRYAANLFGTPSKPSAPDLMLQAYPNPPYNFANYKLIPIPLCLSSIKVEVKSAKDRDIRRITVNTGTGAINGPIVGGLEQKYNFLNERQAVLNFERVQTNILFTIFYEKQAPIRGGDPLIWLDPIDNYTVTIASNKIQTILSKPNPSYFFTQSNASFRPWEGLTSVSRSLFFQSSAGQTTSMELNQQLLPLSVPGGGIQDLTIFTVVEPAQIQADSEWIVWWLGNYRYGAGGSAGYGLVLSGDRFALGGLNPTTPGLPKLTNTVTSYTLTRDKKVLITMTLQGQPSNPNRLKRGTVFINGTRLAGNQITGPFNISTALSSYQFNLGTAPFANTFATNKLHALLVYPGVLTPGRLATINNYLINKFSIPKN
jgi:hypothetical protein